MKALFCIAAALLLLLLAAATHGLWPFRSLTLAAAAGVLADEATR